MSGPRVLIIGGGILGTMHAVSAVERGFDVIQVERDASPRGASVRNFGLVWVSGRASGDELALALRARQRWSEIAERCPQAGFRPNGSITVARTDAELAVMEEAMERDDADARGFRLLDAEEVRAHNPAVRGPLLAGLHCALDAAVEPRLALGALRAALEQTGRYTFVTGAEIREVSASGGRDHRGVRYDADRVIVCPGAAHRGLLGEILSEAPLRRVRLQMFETEPLDVELTTSLADGDSLRYYPAFDLSSRANLPAQDPVAGAHRIQLLCQQRHSGALTVGDTHAYEEPFAFDLDEAPTEYLRSTLASVLGRPAPRIARRWAGVYSQVVAPEGHGPVYFRDEIEEGLVVVTGPGGRGMTLSPAIAEETFA